MKIKFKEFKQLLFSYITDNSYCCETTIDSKNILEEEVKRLHSGPNNDGLYLRSNHINYRSAFLHTDIVINKGNFKIYSKDLYDNLDLNNLLDDFCSLIEKKILS